MSDKVSFLKTKKGSSSALIILLVVLLIFFGVLALVSAASNIRLSEKRATWNETYYRADYEAERVLSSVDQIFQDPGFNLADGQQMQAMIQQQLAAYATIIDLAITYEKPILTVEAIVAADPGDSAGMAIKLVYDPQKTIDDDKMTVHRWSWWSPPFEYASFNASVMEGSDQ